MSEKNRDRQGRWRSKTIAFRVSSEENELINRKVELSGLNKQDYLIHCTLNTSYVIQGSPYVIRSLKYEIKHFAELLSQGKDIEQLNLDELEILEYMLNIIINMRNKKEALIKVEMEPRQ